MTRAAFSVLWALLALPACAGTSGQEWLHSPIDEREVRAAELGPVPPAARGDERPRLRQTITLGESYAGSETPAAGHGRGSSVHVSVHTQVPVTVNNYMSYGPGYVPLAPVRPITPVRGVTPGTGEDFPAPPSHGPSFPYRTTPASPWR